jgi:hypothetical protein
MYKRLRWQARQHAIQICKKMERGRILTNHKAANDVIQ